VEELYGTLRYQSGSFSLINVGSGFHCLRNFSFLFSCEHCNSALCHRVTARTKILVITSTPYIKGWQNKTDSIRLFVILRNLAERQNFHSNPSSKLVLSDYLVTPNCCSVAESYTLQWLRFDQTICGWRSSSGHFMVETIQFVSSLQAGKMGLSIGSILSYEPETFAVQALKTWWHEQQRTGSF